MLDPSGTLGEDVVRALGIVGRVEATEEAYGVEEAEVGEDIGTRVADTVVGPGGIFSRS